MNGYIKRLAAFAISAGMTLSLASCMEKKPKTMNVDKQRTLTLEFDDSYDFSEGACNGLFLSYPLAGNCIVSVENVETPEITFNLHYRGEGTEKTLEQFSRLELTKDTDDNILHVAINDTYYDEKLHNHGTCMNDENNLVFYNTTADVMITLPETFDYYSIEATEADIGAIDLKGEIQLFTHKSVTAENIAFDSNRYNGVDGYEGVIISTSRYNDEKTSAQILSSGGDITYVFPEPSQMSGRDDPDNIILTAYDGNITVDMNGNTYYDIDETPDAELYEIPVTYRFMVGEAAMLAPKALIGGTSDDAYENTEGVTITNGEHISQSRSIPQTTTTAPAKKTKSTTTKAAKTTTTTAVTTFDDYSDNTSVEYHFRTKKQLQQHFEKHGDEFKDDFGYKTAEEYEKGASDVINNSSALHKTEKDDGDYVYYIESTNEFVILSTDGYIRTYFRPNAGKKYYDRQ